MLNFEILALIFNLSVYFALLFLIQNSSVLFSVLTLILIACLFSLYIISFSSFFIGLLYLAIYVGAVTVFILFVVMMTDLSLSGVEDGESEVVPLTLGNLKIISSVTYGKFSSYNFLISNFLILVIVFGFTRLLEHFVFFSFNELGFIHNGLFTILNQPAESQTLELAFALLQQQLAPFLILGLIILITLIGSIFIITQNNKQIAGVGLSALFDSSLLKQPSRKSQDMDVQLLAESKNSIKLNASSF
ncbi:MAG: NADH-quinone oxidoreductase subunit J [Bacteroidales bacterium]|nr:MAG: NADH-quinone oxidoreductase subunit J [Bacteroidales bacterium]